MKASTPGSILALAILFSMAAAGPSGAAKRGEAGSNERKVWCQDMQDYCMDQGISLCNDLAVSDKKNGVRNWREKQDQCEITTGNVCYMTFSDASNCETSEINVSEDDIRKKLEDAIAPGRVSTDHAPSELAPEPSSPTRPSGQFTPQSAPSELAPKPSSPTRPSAQSLSCDAKNNALCISKGAECGVVHAANGSAVDVCRWPSRNNAAACRKTAGIWTTNNSKYAKNHPDAIVPGRTGACITEVKNLKPR